jgi:hypothetical protein
VLLWVFYSHIVGEGESQFHEQAERRREAELQLVGENEPLSGRDVPRLSSLGSQRDRHMMLRLDLQRLLLVRCLLQHYPRFLLKALEIDQSQPHRFVAPGLDTAMEESDIEKPLGRPSKRRHRLKMTRGSV